MKNLLMYCENGYTMDYSDWCSINSYGGWILHCDGKNLYNTYIEPLIKYYIDYYEKYIKGKGGLKNGKYDC